MENLASIRRSLQFLVMIALFVTAYFARDLILPIVLAFLLALTLSPVARFFDRLGVPHAISAFVLIISSALTILAIIGGTAGTIAAWSEDFPRMGSELESKLSGMSEAVENVRSVTEEVEELTGEGEDPKQVVVSKPTLFDSAFDTATRVGATFAVTMVLALFLLSSGDLFYRKIVQAFQTLSGKKRALSTVYAIERRVSRYLLTITVINACLGVCVGLYLTLLGLGSGYVWGIVAFLLNFLPYIGGVIGALMVGAVAIMEFDNLGYALLAPIGYQILTGVEGQLITPWMVGRRLALNTVAVFLTVVFWGWLWGIPGALVAVPVLVVFKVICENFEPLHTIGIFLSGDDDLDPEESDLAEIAASSPGE